MVKEKGGKSDKDATNREKVNADKDKQALTQAKEKEKIASEKKEIDKVPSDKDSKEKNKLSSEQNKIAVEKSKTTTKDEGMYIISCLMFFFLFVLFCFFTKRSEHKTFIDTVCKFI